MAIFADTTQVFSHCQKSIKFWDFYWSCLTFGCFCCSGPILVVVVIDVVSVDVEFVADVGLFILILLLLLMLVLALACLFSFCC